MPSSGSLVTTSLLPLLAILGGFYQFYLRGRFEHVGLFRHFGYPPFEELNNGECGLIKDLEGCEDLWAHPTQPYIYAPCSPPSDGVHWIPAMLHLFPANMPSTSTDAVYLYNTETGKQSKIVPVGLPKGHRGLWLHGIGVHLHEDGKGMSIFLNSHYPPIERELAGKLGADSVVEVYETQVGQESMRWVATIQEDQLRTPNSVAGVGNGKVYVTNDHSTKTGSVRLLEGIYDAPSDVVFCDSSLPAGQRCKVVIENFVYPNGIVAGPNNLIYIASTMVGDVHVYERQADDSLVFVEKIKLPRGIDNIRILPSGAITAAALPDLLAFAAYAKPENILKRTKNHGGDVLEGTKLSPSEIWLVRNETSQDRFYGKKYSAEKIFADKGRLATGATVGLIKGGKLYVSGLLSPWVTVCDLPEEVATAEFSS